MTPFSAIFQYRCFFASPESGGIGGGGGGVECTIISMNKSNFGLEPLEL